MEKNMRSLTLSLFVVLLLSYGIAGCSLGYNPPAEPPAKKNTLTPYNGPDPKTVEECDEFIEKQTKHIDDLEEFIAEQTKINVIYSLENEKSRGWMKGDGNEHGDIADQAQEQIVATQREIDRIKGDVASVKRKKDELEKKKFGCFPANTMVQLGDGTYKSFADIAPGDMVMSYDIGYEKPVSRPVVEVYTVKGNHLYAINGEIFTTSSERFLSQNGWKETSMLKVGDRIHVEGKMLEIKTITYERVDQVLYNMQIKDTHNFYIATKEGRKYLVHNSSDSGGGGGGGGGGGK